MDSLVTVNTKELVNKKLGTQLNKIATEFNKVQKSGEVVARALKEIKDKELWKDDFTSFADSVAMFGIKKAQAYRVIQSVELKDRVEGLVDYTMSQVGELVRLEDEDVKEVLETEQITDKSTCKQIREVVDAYLKEEPEDNGEFEETEDAESDEEFEEDNVVISITRNGKTDMYNFTGADVGNIINMLRDMGYIAREVE